MLTIATQDVETLRGLRERVAHLANRAVHRTESIHGRAGGWRRASRISLQPSRYLDPLGGLDRTGPTITVDPQAFPSWEVFLATHRDWSHLLLRPGDYTSWGFLPITGSGSDLLRRTIRHIDPSHRPWRDSSDRAVLAGVDFAFGASHWIVQGLTLATKTPTQALAVTRRGAEGVVFDSILADEAPTHGVELRGPAGRVQRSVIRNAASIGVMIKGVHGPNIGARVVDNEIVDCEDGVMTSTVGDTPFAPCEDAVIDGNDIYTTGSHRRWDVVGTYSDLENGIDLKAGSDNTQAPIVISNNRLWGFRRTRRELDPDNPNESGGIGSALTIHRGARQVVVFGNVIFDCPVGIQEVSWLCGNDRYEPFAGPRGVLIEYNIFHRIQPFHPLDLGSVLRNAQQLWVIDNDISHSLKLSQFTDTGSVLHANRLFGTGLGAAGQEWNNGTNIVRSARQTRDVVLELGRWTGLGSITLPNAHVNPQFERPGWRRFRTKSRNLPVLGPTRLPDEIPVECRKAESTTTAASDEAADI